MAIGFSDRSRTKALILCIFLGVFGAHRFYLGKFGTGLTMLLIGFSGIVASLTVKSFFWYIFLPLGIWVLYDLILILLGKMKDINGNLVWNW
ncbi:MAG: hypothetical protein CBR30_09340 [Dictyoglomus sp. NZ13-RE01]|nr:MAG: hypothetical protein CBR30_09340 [Dictyoglomus sp. NZ13-RE01]